MVLDFGLINTGLFDSSAASGDGLGADPNTVMWTDVGIGIVPIGAIVAWVPDLPGTPPLLPNFVLCDGTVLSDGDSPLNGQTIPDLNGNHHFLRGADTSGGTGGSTSHGHGYSGTTSTVSYYGATDNAGGYGYTTNHDHTYSGTSNGADGSPPYMNVVWIMRIK